MSISFMDSMLMANAVTENKSVDTASIMDTESASVMTLSLDDESGMIAAYSGDDWVLDNKYLYYSEYYDDAVSSVDKNKNIILDSNQINITQETNSQFIPFEMPRYYDGFDLVSTNLLFHFVNKDGYEDYANPINVYYNSERIRFAWLVDKRVTSVEGRVNFEIQAIGVNSKGDEYIWISKPSNGLNVLKSLSGNGVIEPDNTWITTFLTQVTEQVALAQEAARNAENSVAEAEAAAQQANDAADEAQSIVDTAKEELSASVQAAVDEKVETALLVYYTKAEVDDIVANIDISDQLDEVRNEISNIDGLANFNVEYDGSAMTFYNGESVIKTIEINSDPSVEWTTSYTAIVDERIAASTGTVQADLDSYKETVNADLESIHESVDDLPETLANDYYTKEVANNTFATKDSLAETDQKVLAIDSTTNTNNQNISTLSTKVAELQAEVDTIDKSPRLTYEATYDEEQVYTLWEIEGEGDSEVRTAKGQFKIVGGSGGSSTSSVLKIEYVTKTPLVATVDDRILISYIFSGTDSSGDDVLDGTATWKVGNAIVATQLVSAGENTFDITDYIGVGTQKVTLSITDDAGSLVTKKWTVQKLDVRLESTFDDTLTYPIGTVSFGYTPYGAISKTVHFVLDGKELDTVATSVSGIPMAYDIPSQENGSHLLEVYMTADVNGNTIESNHIAKDILWYDETTPVIGCVQQEFTAKQYDVTNIVCTIYDPTTETPRVTLAEDGAVVSELSLDSNILTWQYKSIEVGQHILTITCGDIVKTLTATIEKLDIKLEPVTAGLAFDFNPTGRSNSDLDRLWSDGDVSMSVSDNFDWVNGGYQIDENGDQYFCIKAGTSAVIDYQLFADDAMRNGKEMKLVFKSTNVQAPDATFLSCIDSTIGTDTIGVKMNVHEAYIYGQAGSLHLPYSEEDIIEFEFNISKNSEAIPMIMGYEDGVSTCPLVYDSSYNFTQNTPKYITLGSEKCDLHIYRFKVYNTSLTARGILNNFIADARNADEMISRYNRNQIYDENGQLLPDVLAEKCPHLRVIKIEAPWFTNNKTDKVTNTTIEYIYKNGDKVLDNWKAYNCMHSGQGTSSNDYGASGRNLDLIMNKSGIDGVDPYIILGDNSRVQKISLTRDSVDVDYLNVKVNIASSENANNALLQRRYNTYNPWKRPLVRDSEEDAAKVKDTMEFYNCVIFIKESDLDISTHREFADNEWHFYAIGNVGDSKKTDETRLTDPDDRYECIVEIMDVEKKNSDFPGDEQGIADLEADKFDESETYGFRYIWEDGTAEENAEVFEFCRNKWIDFYKFVVNSTDEEFHDHLGDYFVLDSALYYYLFTTRYTMVDNRAKNTFWHYGKTGEVDSEGNPIRKWDLAFDYDNDTALGINNYGDMVYRYGYEDTDCQDGTAEEVFRESDSTFFCRLRDLFAEEMKGMFQTLESNNAWSATGLINQWDAWQSEFPEELWRIDIDRKYIRTYNSSFINGAGDAQFLNNMAHGKKKYQRREYERNQEKYMASKYQSSLALSDSSTMRCTVPTGDLVIQPNYEFKITPYAYMYINVQHGTGEPIQVRAEPNIEYTIPFDGDSTDIVNIYSSSMLQSLGDLSPCYAATINVGKASKLKELIVGNSASGYDNPSLTSLTLGANNLLELLNIENVSGLTAPLEMDNLKNLRELYAHGSNVSGIVLPNGGLIHTAEIPAVNALTMRNLSYLTALDMSSYSNLLTLIAENCDAVDVQNIVELSPSLNRVRIVGIDWVLANTELLERIYGMKGKDKNGLNLDQSVLTGTVHVPVIQQQKLYDYRAAWPDLEVTYDTMIEQFSVTFVNDDGSVLEVQYVDKGSSAIDPTTREVNPLNPTKESTASHDFTFSNWDSDLTSVFSDRVITAVYTSSLRSYTIKYVSRGVTMQESTGLYNENVPYTGGTPTYTLEESAYIFYLFNRWDKSGVIDGDKIVNAIFDKFEYTANAFDGKELSDLTPVEIYAMTKMGLADSVIQDKDQYTFAVGNDIAYDDVESELIISEKTSFNGTNYLDTGIQLFDVDKDFVLAIDYEFLDGNSTNAVLAQCFQANGTNGFKLWYNASSEYTGARFTWGTTNSNLVSVNKREMVVVRHRKGENNLVIYNSSLDSTSVQTVELSRTRETVGTGTLVFGCARADDGIYENFGVGNINWCKVWYTDLGDTACRELAMWVHETITLEACGFRKYYLTENTSKRCSFSMLASHLLDRERQWSTSNTNEGGFGNSGLYTALNNRLYYAIPQQIRSLIKQVRVPSSIGLIQTEIALSDCYITIPACIEVNPTMTSEPYVNEGTTISYMTDDTSRRRAFDGGDYYKYWLRSPNAAYTSYVYQVDANGKMYGYSNPYNTAGVLIEISF